MDATPPPRQPRHPNIPGDELPADALPLTPQDDPSELRIPSGSAAEPVAAALLVLAGLSGGAFVAAYLTTSNTQVLGASLGAAFLLVGAALVVAGRWVVPQETVIEARAGVRHPQEQRATAELVRFAGAGVTRARLLLSAGGVAAAGITAGLVTGAGSLGPWIGDASVPSPFRAGVRLVDVNGKPVRAADLAVGSFMTAFAAGVSTDQLGASLMVVRLPESEMRMPPARRGWTPRGIVAYSKICTHAGCAVAMMRYPLFAPHTDGPALVCPCHYSTFDVADGAKVLFGPAGRPLPQLPLRIAADGTLEAAGPLSGDIGPAWFGTDR